MLQDLEQYSECSMGLTSDEQTTEPVDISKDEKMVKYVYLSYVQILYCHQPHLNYQRSVDLGCSIAMKVLYAVDSKIVKNEIVMQYNE